MLIVHAKIYFDTHFKTLVRVHKNVYNTRTECTAVAVGSRVFYVAQVSDLKEISDLTEVEKIIYNVPKEEEV